MRLGVRVLGDWQRRLTHSESVHFSRYSLSNCYFKVVYYTASLPYAFLLPMIIMAADIPGHNSGLTIYLVPKWETLKQEGIWFNAAGQVRGRRLYFQYHQISSGPL